MMLDYIKEVWKCQAQTCRAYKWSENDLEDRVANDARVDPQKRLLTPFLFDKTLTPIPCDDSERSEFPFQSTNFISETFFSWCNPTLKVGYVRTLYPEDMYKISPGSKNDVQLLADKFNEVLEKRKLRSESDYLKTHGMEDTPSNRESLSKDPNFQYSKYLVALSLLEVFRSRFIFCLLIRVVGDLAAGLNTLQVRKIVSIVGNHSKDQHTTNQGYGYAVGISLVVMFQGLAYCHYFHSSQFCGGEIRSVLSKVLLDKSFTINRDGRSRYPPSQVTSLLANDLSKIELAIWFFGFITNLPLGLVLTIILLTVNLGGASLTGIAYFLIVTAITSVLTKHFMKNRIVANLATDNRIRCIKEVLASIKIIKYFAWEIPYSRLLTEYRSSEMSQILRIQFIRNVIVSVVVTLPNVSAMISFLVMFGANHGHLSATSNIFSSVSLYNTLTGYVSQFPSALNTAGDAIVALKRIQEFLLFEDEKQDPGHRMVPGNASKNSIEIEHGFFDWNAVKDDNLSVESDTKDDQTGSCQIQWDEKEEESHGKNTHQFQGLKDVNLSIKQGEFVVVTGPIGTGKSSLLNAIKGAMPRTKGLVTIAGDATLCSDPWIQNTTVEGNILFGSEQDRQKYNKVVDACALASDFDMLPAGDQTEIGERGVNLSGGQKARINLARAVYHVYGDDDRNIILLDDVLSAVDPKVSRHIVNECILGLLDGKTRILATHQLSLIDSANRIIFINNDGKVDVGSHDELTGRNAEFARLMEFQLETSENEDSDEDDTDTDDDDTDDVSLVDVPDEKSCISKMDMEDLKVIRCQTSKAEYEEKTAGVLMSEESRKVNGIPLRILLMYLREGCGKCGIKFLVPSLIASMTCTTFCMLFQNIWLSFWSSDHFSGRSNGFYAGLYVLFTVLFVLSACWQFCTVVYICNTSSKNLNIKAMHRIMYAPMSFFDTTPMGRIINRFTKDTDTLDNSIAEQARLFCYGCFNMGGILIMCCVFLPWFAIVVPFILLVSYICFSYYQASAREIKRIEGIQRSVVFATFDEVLQGLATIKFYDMEKVFMRKNAKLINKQNEAYYLSNGMQRWLVARLVVCSAAMNLIIETLCVSNVFNISAASSGLLISYLVSFSTQLVSTSRSMGQLEQFLSSAERVAEYSMELPQEAAYNSSAETTPADSWPERGKIVFKNLCMRYRPSLPYVLNNFSAHIKPGEKVGICGRTGAGKSTIMTALYRICEPEKGTIEIDGVNTLQIGLYDLRSKLTIIPQEPVLFRGTIRQNLDPFNTTSDEKLYEALIKAGCITASELKDIGTSSHDLMFHLDSFVEDNGANYSLGQRQVLALCRALIKKTKILILDEATSNVDYETDARIQNIIKREFTDCTILSIAHRLKTIVNYDRILVMDKGRCVEFDTPWTLFNTKDSIFRSMCDKSHIVSSDFDSRE